MSRQDHGPSNRSHTNSSQSGNTGQRTQPRRQSSGSDPQYHEDVVPPLHQEDSVHDEQNSGSNYQGRYEYHESIQESYYPRAHGLVQENASITVIGGYHYPSGREPTTNARAPPITRRGRVTTFYEGATNMHQINTSILSVGGNVYGALPNLTAPPMREYHGSNLHSGGNANDRRYPVSPTDSHAEIFSSGQEPPYSMDPRRPNVRESQNQGGRQNRNQGHSQTIRAETNINHFTRTYSNFDEDYEDRRDPQYRQLNTAGPSTALPHSRSTSIGGEIILPTQYTSTAEKASAGPYITPAPSASSASISQSPVTAESSSVSVNEFGLEASPPESPAPSPGGKVKRKKHKKPSTRYMDAKLSRVYRSLGRPKK